MAIKFDLPKDQLSIIKVIGVGGGGSNAVNHMYEQGIKDVDFMVCNTDQQALDQSPVPSKVQLGATLTSGLGAGSRSDVGENAAIESIEDVKIIIGEHTKMLFITAGMGGGTGTGAAPIIAKAAKDMGILTVGIVTMPFSFEGKKRRKRAEEGMSKLRDNVDTLLVINNDKLRELFGNLTLDNAFEQADNVLTTAAKGIAETITYKGKINVDFNDVRTVMSNSGVAILGSSTASGENRALIAIEEAVNSPLLNDNEIRGAAHILLNITYGDNNILMDEISEITDFIEDKAHEDAEVIWGHGIDSRLGEDEISITIVATGFQSNPDTGVETIVEKPTRIVRPLDEQVKTELTKPLEHKPAPKQANIFEQPERVEEKPKVVEEPQVTEEPIIVDSTPEELPEEDVTIDTLQSEPEEEEVVAEEKPIVRHTLEDDTWGSFQETEPTQETSNESPEVEQEFDLEPTLKSDTVSADADTVAEDDEMNFQVRIEEKNTEEQTEPSVTAEKASPQFEQNSSEQINDTSEDNEERQSNLKERMTRLRNLSSMLKSPAGISSLESEPAFKRRSVELDDVKPSNERQVSRLTLSESEDEDGDKKVEIKPNNSFLHDNVD